MTAEPVEPATPRPSVPLDSPEHPLYLSQAQILALSDEHFQLYRRVLEAEAQGLGVPIEGSPGELADEITGGTELHPEHLKLVDEAYLKLERGEIDRLLITMPPQHGKEVADREPVLTTNGWKRHGDLVPGDEVFGPDGQPAKVLWVGEPSIQKMLVTFSDGTSLTVHPLHEWTVYDRSRTGREIRTVETGYLATQRLTSGRRMRFHLPHRQPLQMPTAALPIDPYTLGVWLGDGTSTQALICGAAADLEHITARIPYERGTSYVHAVTGVAYQRYRGLWTLLRAVGILGDKHIPAAYQLASEAQRRALLAGLVDTDGSLSAAGQVRFVTANRRLAGDVRMLVRGLGYRAGLDERAPTDRDRPIRDKHTCWVVSWTPLDGLAPGTLPRKALARTGLQRRVAIRSVDPAPDELGRCIEVDRADGLYLVGEQLVPTHNSTRTRWGSLHRLKNHPDHRIVVASAELDLAREHTRWVRNTIEAHSGRLGMWTARDRRSARAWDLQGQRGGMYAVGVGGALTGRPADMLVLDDPVKDSKAVEKPEQREALWKWWTEVAMTRLAPKASVVVVMTRWHEDDIAGRILKSDDAHLWHVLHLPAICDDDDTDLLGRDLGEALWSSRYDLAFLDRQRKMLGSRSFAALYQGRPVPAGGTLLQRHWFTVQDDWPRYGRPLRYWDLAATAADEGGDPDWTVGVLVVLDAGRWWVVEMERFRASPHELRKRLIATRNRDGLSVPIRAEQEPGSSGKIVVHDLATTVFAGYDFRAKPSTGSKLLRANPLAAAAEAGNVVLLDGPWVSDFLDEAESFPFGAHDDMVDAISGAMAWLTAPVEQERIVQQARWGQVPSRR